MTHKITMPASSPIRRALAKWLAPEMAMQEERAKRLWGWVDEARWWLGAQHPEPAALAEYLIARDRWYWSLGDAPHVYAWSPPPWVNDIDSFRGWLRSGQLQHKASSPDIVPTAVPPTPRNP